MSAVYRHMRAEHFGVRWYCSRCDMSFKHRETFVQVHFAFALFIVSWPFAAHASHTQWTATCWKCHYSWQLSQHGRSTLVSRLLTLRSGCRGGTAHSDQTRRWSAADIDANGLAHDRTCSLHFSAYYFFIYSSRSFVWFVQKLLLASAFTTSFPAQWVRDRTMVSFCVTAF